MNQTNVTDWRFVVALGVIAIGTIFAIRMDSEAIEEVSIHAIDAAKEFWLTKSEH